MKASKRLTFSLIGVPVVVLASLMPVVLRAPSVSASDDQTECEGVTNKVKAVASKDWHQTDIDYAQNGYNVPGVFDATPLVHTHVSTREGDCITVHFSTMAQPVDNSIVFQARVDGKPMQGHLSAWSGGIPWDEVPTPAVAEPDFRDELLGVGIPGFDPTIQNPLVGVPRMVSYTFFQRVQPGTHRIEVYFAGCCSGSGAHPGSNAARAGSPTLIVYYG